MDASLNDTKTYTIREAAKISGLPESTLRYYESIGLIDPIERDVSSKYRVYSENDVNLVIAIACLNATGLSLDGMREYMANRNKGADAADEQVSLLEEQEKHLADELHYMQLRLKYVKEKISFWRAVKADDTKAIEASRVRTHAIADKMKLPKTLDRQD